MRSSQTYWYNLSTQSVIQADERPSEDCLGPFGSAAEAQDSPAVLVEYARAWLDSEESEPFREMAAELDDGADYTYD
ncbi:MAG: hypothetical protein ABS63_09885 [Microbacterium sp. SCN 70-27]|uniref:hypothetical protein n=1 Tax=unclassified Microbacterium TaxID=2609290 RepID=UPI00086C9C5C|nr:MULTISPECIES: hypothetical protein [unclassified Microbacterium]MBN9225346.1 hypothetical protein [Microbacterium sp.]ODT27043.1 MAG: hypothetical protein ABS63_09885 [Microbacterium sp. SCN 70-27]